jgi:hypothetical protein
VKTAVISAALLIFTFLTVPHAALAQSSNVWDTVDATTLTQQITELATQGRYAEAVPLAQRALALREKALGPNHADVALSLGYLATLYQKLGSYTDAEPLFRRNLTIWETLFGPSHILRSQRRTHQFAATRVNCK